MNPPTWDDLPPTVRHTLTERFGATEPPTPVSGGFTAGVRIRLPAADGPVFVKAIRADDTQAVMYRTEAAANAALPHGIGPLLLMSTEEDGWVTLVFEYVDGRHPDLSPGSPDLDAVMSSLARLHDSLTPCPLADAPDIAALPLFDGLVPHLDAMGGDTLLHCDLRADNLFIGDRVNVIDWAWPHRGAAWIDTAFLVPQLILAGQTAEDAEKHAHLVPAYREAPDAAVTSFATALTAYWTRRAQQGNAELRAYRARAIQAGTEWTRHRST